MGDICPSLDLKYIKTLLYNSDWKLIPFVATNTDITQMFSCICALCAEQQRRMKFIDGMIDCAEQLFVWLGVIFSRYLQEYSALGTAGGLYHFRDQIMTGGPEMFFVMNADVCGDFPLQGMLDFHRTLPSTAICTMLATEVWLASFADFFSL